MTRLQNRFNLIDFVGIVDVMAGGASVLRRYRHFAVTVGWLRWRLLIVDGTGRGYIGQRIRFSGRTRCSMHDSWYHCDWLIFVSQFFTGLLVDGRKSFHVNRYLLWFCPAVREGQYQII